VHAVRMHHVMDVKDVKDVPEHVKDVPELFLSDNIIRAVEGRRLPSFTYRRIK